MKSNKNILFIVPHRKNRSPGQRFRFEQYLDFLKENGYDHTYSNIISEEDDKIFYSKGKYLKKLFIVFKSIKHRRKDLKRASRYDAALIYREAFMLGSTCFERKLKKKTRLVFDFDDSIWLNDVSHGNTELRWLKKPAKTKKIIQLADMTFAGNQYLADFASEYGRNVKVVPTTIDTNYHKRTEPKKMTDKICIGWTGTQTTLKHFEVAIPFLEKLKRKFGDKICFKVIVDFPYEVKSLDLIADQWKLETEIADLMDFDIGLMPLPNDEWASGKCGFKGLQYMSLEIPTIMSPVGVNKEIINHEVNGFLAESEEEWVEIISRLIENDELRKSIGKKGRETVIEKYSVDSQKEKYLEYFNELTSKSE